MDRKEVRGIFDDFELYLRSGEMYNISKYSMEKLTGALVYAKEFEVKESTYGEILKRIDYLQEIQKRKQKRQHEK